MHIVCCVSDIALQGMACGTLAFGCTMNVNVPAVTVNVAISTNQQSQTDAHPSHENQHHTHNEHEVGQQVHVNNHFSSTDELRQAWVGPFPTVCVHANGAFTIQCGQMQFVVSSKFQIENSHFSKKWSELGVSCIARQVWCLFGTVFVAKCDRVSCASLVFWSL